MEDKITGELIRSHGKALRDLEISGQRAAELAIEVERHNRAILNAASMLDFNDEPAKFLSALAELKHPAPPRARARPRRK